MTTKNSDHKPSAKAAQGHTVTEKTADGVRPTPAERAPEGRNTTRYVFIALLVVAAFFGAFQFASANSANVSPGGLAAAAGNLLRATDGAGAGGAGAGGGCCGGGGGGAPVEGSATVSGAVQKIDVDLSTGSYNPNVIKLKAGVPAEITFGQSSGCTGVVQSGDLGFSEDLSSGPKTVKLDGLQPGTYGFACGMNMVTGQIVVE